MTKGTIKVETAESDRTAAEAARAAPVSLPAGSYDVESLSKALDKSALAKHDDERDEMREKIVDEHNQTRFDAGTLGVPPGYERRTVEDTTLGVTEERVIYDPGKEEEAQEAQDEAPPAIRPGAVDTVAASKGE